MKKSLRDKPLKEQVRSIPPLPDGAHVIDRPGKPGFLRCVQDDALVLPALLPSGERVYVSAALGERHRHGRHHSRQDEREDR